MAEPQRAAFRWALSRSKQRRNSYAVSVVLIGLVLAAASNFLVAPSNASTLVRISYSVGSFLVAVGLSVIVVLGWSFLRAPYEQRDGQTVALAASEAKIKDLHDEITRLKAPPPAPALRFDSSLETDVAANCFRLRVRNDNGTAAKACVELVRIVDRENKSLVDESQLPIELAWSHHEWGRPTLTAQNTQGLTVAVLCLDQRANAAEAELYVYGAAHKPKIGRIHERLKGETIYATMTGRSPEHSGVDPVERTFVLRADPAAPLGFVP